MKTSIDVSKITEADIIRAIAENDFNEALCIIQEAIGQDDGGVAGMHFSDVDDEIWDVKENRRKIIVDYLETEKRYAEI